MVLTIIVVFALTWHSSLGILLENSTSDKEYVPELKLMSVEFVEKSLIASDPVFKYRKVNKTQFSLNVDFELLQDLDGEKLTITSELYVLLNNHYKFTGVRQVNNACGMWKQNYYFIRNILQKYSNIDACNVVKKRYWVKDFILDTSSYPKSIPLGTYKGVVSVDLDGTKILQLAYYLKLNYYANWEKQSSNRLKIKVFN